VNAGKFLLLPLTSRVRRGAVLAGFVSSMFAGGFPSDHGPAFLMGRVVLLHSATAFLLHMVLGVLYAAGLAFAIAHTRGWWTLVTALLATFLLYAGNLWVMRAWDFPLLGSEAPALAAHFLFGVVFTILFKAGDDDAAPETVRHSETR